MPPMSPLGANLVGALPELLLITAALGILGVARLWHHQALVGGLTLAALVGAAAALVTLTAQGGGQLLFHAMLIRTALTTFFQLSILGVTVLITLLTLGYRPLTQTRWPELFALLLLSTTGLLLITGAQNLVMVYVGLELVSITSYLMTAFLQREPTAAEGGLKYFLYGTLATGMMLYGISWLYGATGTLDLSGLTLQLAGGLRPSYDVVFVGMVLLIVGLGFKIAVVPFHHWAPDAYEAAPTPVAAFISAGPKLAGFALLLRLFWIVFHGLTPEWAAILSIVAVLTMTLGNLAALGQTNVKRLLAYSSIAQAGYIVLGVVVATPSAGVAVGYYALVYVLMNLAAFACVIAVSNATQRDDLGAYAGLAQTHPGIAAAFAIALIALAGIPPTGGFLAKVWIFFVLLERGHVALAIIAAVNSVIAVYYYAGLLKQLYLRPAPTDRQGPQAITTWPLRVALGASLAGVILLGLWPTPLLHRIFATLPSLADTLPLLRSA